LQGASIKELLGIVGADYQVCQNRELAEFTDALAQSGKVTIETCGSIRGGKRVWFLARGEAFDVGGKDEVWPYVLVSNGHDHQQAIRVTPTTIRVVCSNTLHMVLPQAGGAETAAIAIRHSGRIQGKLEEAKKALKHYSSILKQNQDLFNSMQSQKIGKDAAMQLFANAYSSYWTAPTSDELSNKDAKVRTLAERRQERMKDASAAFMERYNREKNALKLGDSLWCAFNAMSGYLQHDKAEVRGVNFQDKVAKRIDRNLFGVNAQRTQEVLAQALALAV
jgi:phage/plasmid-like protein (TIGR03299 family)